MPTTTDVAAPRRVRRRRQAAIPRHDGYIAEPAGDLALLALWRELKRQDVDDARRPKDRRALETTDGDC